MVFIITCICIPLQSDIQEALMPNNGSAILNLVALNKFIECCEPIL